MYKEDKGTEFKKDKSLSISYIYEEDDPKRVPN